MRFRVIRVGEWRWVLDRIWVFEVGVPRGRSWGGPEQSDGADGG
jgi:hypothetical protein